MKEAPTAKDFPSEILLNIFQRVQEQEQSRVGELRLVCRRWHELIISTSSLWRHLEIHYDYESPGYPDEKFSLYHKYSAGTIKSMKITCNSTGYLPSLHRILKTHHPFITCFELTNLDAGTPIAQDTDILLDSFLRRHHKIRELVLKGFQILFPSIDSILVAFPQLEKLDIQQHNFKATHPVVSKVSDELVGHPVESIELVNFPIRRQSTFPVDKLVNLRIQGHVYEFFNSYKIRLEPTHMETCQFLSLLHLSIKYYPFKWYRGPNIHQTIVLDTPALRSLELIDSSFNSLTFTKRSLAQLESLHLEGISDMRGLDNFAHLMSNLRELSLDSTKIYPTTMLNYVAKWQNLERVRIFNTITTDGFIDELRNAAPRIHTLEIRDTRVTHELPQSITLSKENHISV